MSGTPGFLQWLRVAAPPVHDSLAPAPQATEVARLVELAAPLALPNSFLALYQLHDGQLDEDLDFVPYFYLMPIDQIVGSHDALQEFEDDDGEVIWKTSWIPFARFDCDYLFVDTKTGSVHAYYPKFDDAWPMIATSFEAYLTQIREAMETGLFGCSVEDGMTDDPDAKLNWVAVWEKRVKRARPKATRKPKAKKTSK